MISSWRKFSDANLPTKAKAGGCYINSFLATNEARRAGYDEALLLDQGAGSPSGGLALSHFLKLML